MPANFITRWFGISQPLFQRDRHEANLFNSQNNFLFQNNVTGRKTREKGKEGTRCRVTRSRPSEAQLALFTQVRGRLPVRVRGWLGGMFSLGHKFPEHSRGDRWFRETQAQDGTNAHADSESNTH
ncbi:unnamed protein product, partial [Ixodes persulcatus]